MFLRYLVLILAITQSLAPYLPRILGFGRMIGEQGGMDTFPLLPAGYAFGIWFPIFVGCIVFGRYCITSKVEKSIMLRCAGIFGLITAWSVVVSYTDIFRLPVVIFVAASVLLLTLVKPLLQMIPLQTGWKYRIILVPLLMFVGRSNTAFWLNMATALNDYGIQPRGLSENARALVLLACIVAYHYATTRWLKLPTPTIATYLWASIAVVVTLYANASPLYLLWPTVAHCIVLVGILTTRMARLKK